MKISQYLALLKCDLPLALAALAQAVIYGLLGMKMVRNDLMYSLNFDGPETILIVAPFSNFVLLFLNTSYGIVRPRIHAFNSLEFFFTRPIPRISLFGIKAGLYLFLSLAPLLVFWACSHVQPVIRIQPLYRTYDDAKNPKALFYLTHFEGAYVQEEGEKESAYTPIVVLPKGQVERATFTLIWVFSCALIFQMAAFAFAPTKPWIVFLIYPVPMMIPLMAAFHRQTLSPYEIWVGWIAQHTLLAFVGLGILTVLAQVYCCRRFVRTEITS